MTEEKQIKEEKKYGFLWFIVVAFLLTFLLLNFKYVFVPWSTFFKIGLVGLLVFGAIFMIYKFIIPKKEEIERTRRQGARFEKTSVCAEYLEDWMKYRNLYGNFGVCDVGEIISSKAQEDTAAIDTKVMIARLTNRKTLDEEYYFMETELNEIFVELRKIKKRKNPPFHRHCINYIALVNQLEVQVIKNMVEEEKVTKIQEMVNNFAIKAKFSRMVEVNKSTGEVKETYMPNVPAKTGGFK